MRGRLFEQFFSPTHFGLGSLAHPKRCSGRYAAVHRYGNLQRWLDGQRKFDGQLDRREFSGSNDKFERACNWSDCGLDDGGCLARRYERVCGT